MKAASRNPPSRCSSPQTYLDEDSEVETYPTYVTDAITGFVDAADADYNEAPDSMTTPLAMSPEVLFPGARTTNRTNMSPVLTTQQLRARGVYADYITGELRTIIDCLEDGGNGQTCGVGASNTALEIIPFFDVQLTWLGRWAETPVNVPISVTNDEAIETGNTHDRGRATLTSGSGASNIDFRVNRGNLGLTGSDPIDPAYSSALREYRLHALAVVAATPPVTTGFLVKGTITSQIPGVKASDVVISASNAQCNRTLTGYECIVSGTSGRTETWWAAAACWASTEQRTAAAIFC